VAGPTVNWLVITPWPLSLIALCGALTGFRQWCGLNGAVQRRAFLRRRLSMVLATGLWAMGRAHPVATLPSAATLAQLGTALLVLWHPSGGLGRAARWASGVRPGPGAGWRFRSGHRVDLVVVCPARVAQFVDRHWTTLTGQT
jgi:hypothetical protein